MKPIHAERKKRGGWCGYPYWLFHSLGVYFLLGIMRSACGYIFNEIKIFFDLCFTIK